MPEDEQRESRLLEYTAENNPVLGRPKSWKGKSATLPEAIPSSILKEVPSPMGQAQEHGRKAILEEAVTSALNACS